MPRLDVNPRTAGRTRPNAKAERGRVKLAWRADETPIGPLQDWTTDTLVILLDRPAAPTPDYVQKAAAEALGQSARLDDLGGTVRQAKWELGVRWASREYAGVNRKHAAWVAVEVLAAPAGASAADRLGRVGMLLGALALTAAVAVVRPATEDVRVVTPDVAALLAGGRAAEAFGG